MRFFTKPILIAAAVLFFFILLSQSCTTIDASHEGIKVSKIGSDRGANDIENVTGWVFYNPFTSFIEQYPIYTQTKDFDSFQVTTRDGAVFSVDPTLNYKIQRGQAATIYRNYRKDLPSIENSMIRNLVYNAYRDIANQYTSDSLMRSRANFENLAEVRLTTLLAKDGFQFEQITSGLTPPASLQAAIDAKNQAVQVSLRLQNQIAATKAQAEINVTAARGAAQALIIKAEGEAKANQLRQASLTPLLVQMRWIEAWEKGGSHVPTVAGGNGAMLYQLPASK